MDLYNICVEDNNITYSIDKLRLKTYITYSTFSELEFRFKTCWKDYVKQFYTSNRIKNFFYNYNIEIEEGKSFYFAFLHNTEKRVDNEREEYNFTIEFNPNKLKDNKVVMYLLGLSGNWYIKSYDLAMDLKINILDLIVDNSIKRRKDMKIDRHGFDDLTITFGKNDGRVKVYNKKIESNLNMMGDLTRVEVSRCLEDYPIKEIGMYKYGDVFPEVYTNNYLFSFSDYKDKTTLAVLFAVQNGFPITYLTKSYKAKIKKMLTGGYKIRFNEKMARSALSRTIFYYFLKNDLEGGIL